MKITSHANRNKTQIKKVEDMISILKSDNVPNSISILVELHNSLRDLLLEKHINERDE